MESVKSVNTPFKCNICNKNYKSKNSLGNHNRKFHTKSTFDQPKSTFDQPKSTLDQPKSTLDQPKSTFDQPKMYKYNCKYCNKGYNINQSKWKHEKKCNKNIEKTLNEKCKKLEKENEELEKKNEELKLDFQKQMDEMKEQLKQLLNKNCKIHPKTLQKINC